MIEGTSPGRILVDDPEHPRAALLGSAEGYFLAGDPDLAGFVEDLGAHVSGRMFAGEGIREDEDGMVLVCHPDRWEQHAGVLFGGREPILEQRRRYQLAWWPALASGCSPHSRGSTEPLGVLSASRILL